jgi:hypothetical protein
MQVQQYTSGQIDTFLLGYQIFVADLAETAAEWNKLDAEERSDYDANLIQIWGNRKLLGTLFQAGKLNAQQERRLATLDRQLLEQSGAMKQCFGFDLSQLLNIFQWGTPLAESVQPLHLEVEPVLLNRLATAFALSPTT